MCVCYLHFSSLSCFYYGFASLDVYTNDIGREFHFLSLLLLTHTDERVAMANTVSGSWFI